MSAPGGHEGRPRRARRLFAGAVALMAETREHWSVTFAPVIQPTLDTGTQALVVAAHWSDVVLLDHGHEALGAVDHGVADRPEQHALEGAATAGADDHHSGV